MFPHLGGYPLINYTATRKNFNTRKMENNSSARKNYFCLTGLIIELGKNYLMNFLEKLP